MLWNNTCEAVHLRNGRFKEKQTNSMCVFYNDLVIESVGTKVKKKGENLGTQLQGKIHPRDYTKTLARIFDKYH